MNKLAEIGLRPKEIRLMRKKDTGNADGFHLAAKNSCRFYTNFYTNFKTKSKTLQKFGLNLSSPLVC